VRGRSFVVGVLVAACAACGDDGATVTPDAPSDGPGPDEVVFPGCTEFDSASPVMVPVRVIGQLGNADVQSPAMCDDVTAPFGIESNGPDRVIPLEGLEVGAPYIVRLTSPSDLAFYVATGCETPAGPSAAQCLLFADATRTERELGRFVANATTAFVVVDYWESQAPDSTDFTLEVYKEACTSGGQCGGSSPACFEGQCVQCVTSFECGSASSPVCGANQVCAAGSDSCASDDAVEPDDDGPAGATPIVLDGTGHAAITARICSVPRTEYDYYAFEVGTLGETWQFSLAWTGVRDLDLGVYDPSGTQMGLSFWEQPETIRLSYLAPGTYHVRVRDFTGGANPVPVNYTLSAQRTLGAGCSSSAQCAAEYRNQIYRGNCLAGSCVSIDAPGDVPEGGACDSASDCGPNLSCPSFFFVSDADTRETCSRACANDGDCAPLGTDHVCTTYLTQNFCVQKCTENDHCPTSIQSDPASGPWARLRCDMPTGRCVP
jgi:hypothetical protein